jgi:hypothetical protein
MMELLNKLESFLKDNVRITIKNRRSSGWILIVYNYDTIDQTYWEVYKGFDVSDIVNDVLNDIDLVTKGFKIGNLNRFVKINHVKEDG